MPSAPSTSVSEYLKIIPPSVRPTFEAARRMVVAVDPKAAEVTYRSQPPRSSSALWKIVRYATGGEYAVGIGVYPTYVSLFFYRGRELDQDSGLLEGGGKEMRFVRMRQPADAERPEVKRMVRKAFKLAGSKSA